MRRRQWPNHVSGLSALLLGLSAFSASANPIESRTRGLDGRDRSPTPDVSEFVGPGNRPSVPLPDLPYTLSKPPWSPLAAPPAALPPAPEIEVDPKVAIPEPASIVLLTTGLIGLLARRYLRRNPA